MKLSSALTILVLATTPLVAMPIVRPFWNDYQSVVRDCVDTKPERRTPAQKENCKPRGGPIGLIIPGIL